MHIVFVAAEAVPYVKTGGLGDVLGALPAAIAALGHRATIVIPLYRQLIDADLIDGRVRGQVRVVLGEQPLEATIRAAANPPAGTTVFFVDQPHLYDRPGVYGGPAGDFPDNCERFSFLARCALELAEPLELDADCYHAHDWHAGLVGPYLKTLYADQPRLRNAGCAFTIHNIAFQGNFEREQWPILGLPRTGAAFDALDHNGRISFLKGGIVAGDWVTTVSQSYAKEIQSPSFGAGMDTYLRRRAGQLTGIVNGIDTRLWDPSSDAHLKAHYDANGWRTGKRAGKEAVLREFGLPIRPAVPLLAMVSRLSEQKGLELLEASAKELLREELALAILGMGEYGPQASRLAEQYPDKVAVRLAFDEPLAHRIYAAADMLVMPSRFEPCGLSQLCGFRYGTVPIVHAVGGLRDTVVDATPEALRTGRATGLVFDEYTPEAFVAAVRRAFGIFRTPDRWAGLVEAGMAQDWSWRHSAGEYLRVYERACSIARARTQD